MLTFWLLTFWLLTVLSPHAVSESAFCTQNSVKKCSTMLYQKGKKCHIHPILQYSVLYTLSVLSEVNLLAYNAVK